MCVCVGGGVGAQAPPPSWLQIIFFSNCCDTNNGRDLTTTSKGFEVPWFDERFYGSQPGIKLWYGLSINPVPIYTSLVW